MTAQHSYEFSSYQPVTSSESLLNQPILIVDSDDLFLATSKRLLSTSGFANVHATVNRQKALAEVRERYYKLIIIDISSDTEQKEGLTLARTIKSNGYGGLVSIISIDPSPEAFFEAHNHGADDYLIKGSELDLHGEVLRLLRRAPHIGFTEFRPERLEELGFFRSQGLSPFELRILSAFSDGFPRHGELAKKTGKSEDHLRKIFSRIYSKLGWQKAYNNVARLSQLITICAMYQ